MHTRGHPHGPSKTWFSLAKEPCCLFNIESDPSEHRLQSSTEELGHPPERVVPGRGSTETEHDL